MSIQTYVYRFIVANALTVYYSFIILLKFLFNFMRNPFGDPFALKLRLEPPQCLTDPKYGAHKYIKVNNIKLHYVESGDPSKPLMLFVHGFPEFWYSWRHQIVEFSKDYWCIAIDTRGYGDSERPDGVDSYKMECLVEDIRDLVRQLGKLEFIAYLRSIGREKCILVGHDWGGMISTKVRDTYPEILNGIIILASTSPESWIKELWSNPKQMKMSAYVFLFRMPWIPEKLFQMNNLEALDVALRTPGKNSITLQDVECYKYWFGKQHTLTAPINYYRANYTYVTPEKKYSEEDIPFLLVMEENDPYLCPSITENMKKEYKHIETIIVKGCGHFLQQEEPAKINALMRDFLKKHSL